MAKQTFKEQTSGRLVLVGSDGSPEGVETAPVGSICVVAASAATAAGVYVKTSGSGNTGWVANYPISGGLPGGQTIVGGTASGNNLVLQSTSNGTKGHTVIGVSGTDFNFDEVNHRLGIGVAAPARALHVGGNGVLTKLGDGSGDIQLVVSTQNGSGAEREWVRFTNTGGATNLVTLQNNKIRLETDGSITMTDGTNLATGTTTGMKIGTATSQKIAFFNATPVVQQTRGGTLTNNVTSGGTTDQIDDFTSLTVYATDAAAIRNDIYQLARAVRQHDVALRALGFES